MASAVKGRHDKSFSRYNAKRGQILKQFGAASTAALMMKTTAQGVFDKNKIERADNFLKGGGRAVNA